MSVKTRHFLLKAVAFCLLFTALFFPLQELFVRKSLEKPWDMTRKISGFYQEPENAFPVLYFGSSHAYASFSPLEIWQETGVTGYVFSTQMQPMWASVTYLREALKTQKPALIVLETNMLYAADAYMESSVNHSFMDDIPLSMDKIRLARTAADEGERFSLVVNFMRYHARWSSLKTEDFAFRRNAVRDPYKGFVILPPKVGGDVIDRWDLSGATGVTPLTEKNERYLREFIEICRENDIDLWLTKAPSNLSPENMQIMNAAAEIAAEYGVPFDDFNSEQAYAAIGVTAAGNFFDQRHMDIVGAERFSRYFSRLLLERYPDLPRDAENADFAADNAVYRAAVDEAIANPVAGTTTAAAEDQ